MTLLIGVIGEGKITGYGELGIEDFQQYEIASRRLLLFNSDQQLFQMTYLNYKDFIELVGKYYEEYVEDSAMNWPRMNHMILNINRYILNFLSSFRTFLDHTETNLKRRYGDGTEQVQRFKEACVKEYDSEFAYRFLYRLRNYAQHCGMPIGHLSFNSKSVNRETGEVSYDVSIKFDRDLLLKNFDKWSTVKPELEALSKEFEVTQYINRLMISIERINSVANELDMPEIERCAKFIYHLFEPLLGRQEYPCILNTDALQEDGGNINIIHPPFHIMQNILRSNKANLYNI